MMTIKDLLNEWKRIKESCVHKNVVIGGIPYFARGEDYDKWLAKCCRYLQNYPNDTQAQQFIELTKSRGTKEDFSTLVGILKAIDQIPIVSKVDDIDVIIEKICKNFHLCAKSLLNRRDERTTIQINDEYDVQDLLQGILRLFVEDIRLEEYVPSYAGANSRTDFFLPQHETFIETKMIRKGLDDKKVGDELIIDIARYESRCKKLICFIYDKNNELKNPYGLISDLEKKSTNNLSVKVFISPL